jgi:hypothetical protein
MVWSSRYSSCHIRWPLSSEFNLLFHVPSSLTSPSPQWFGTYNYLDANLPLPQTLIQKLLRQAFIGFSASVISDTISNSLRVVKTYRQVNETRIGYVEAAKRVIAVDGFWGFLGRGLPTRILANGLQGLMFSVLWKLFMDMFVSFLFIYLGLQLIPKISIAGTRRIKAKSLLDLTTFHILLQLR